MIRPRVLVAGETSGRTRDALTARGIDAVSCDFLPHQVGGPHIQGNAFDHFNDGWDAMVAHPTCTKLTVAAAWCMYHPDDKALPYAERRPHPDFPNRRAEQDEAADDFIRFIEAPIAAVIVENPVGVMATRYRSADQYVQPNWFGDDASKRTGLWLEGRAPRIIIPDKALWFPGRIVTDPKTGKLVERWSNQTDSGQNRLGPSELRWKLRSDTFPGIANALADALAGYLLGVTYSGSETNETHDLYQPDLFANLAA